jgi:hypothetical protein
VDRSRRRGREVPREAVHGIRRHAGHPFGQFRGETGHRIAHPVHAVHVLGRGCEVALQQFTHDGEQHRGIGARADEVVLVGDLCGLGAARVEHDESP